ncbi:MAG: hypothetical protein ACLRPT_01570 [Akkermansia muciniphila]
MKAAGEEGMEGVSAFEAYVHRAFAPDGLFSRARDFEYREEQQSMALAVARALRWMRRCWWRPAQAWANPWGICCRR